MVKKKTNRRAGDAAARQRVEQNDSAEYAPQGLEFHPLADLFPLLEGAEFEEVVEDVRAHGVREPIWIYEEQILEGRNRYRAPAAAGVPCPMRPFEGDDPLAFVISMNLKRRHLTPEQKRAAVEGLLKAAPRKSDRQVAREAGVSHTQVAKVRRDLEASGDVATVATSPDSLGREQPRARKRRQSEPPTASPAVEPSDLAADLEAAAQRIRALMGGVPVPEEPHAEQAEASEPAAEGEPPERPKLPDPVRKQLVAIVNGSVNWMTARNLSEDERRRLLEALTKVRERVEHAIEVWQSMVDSNGIAP